MNGFIRKSLAALLLTGGLTFFTGCYGGPTAQQCYNKCVDPCWPERYTAMASDAASAPFAAQVENGHVLDQSIWNSHFERGTPVLTPGGQMLLTHLSQARPSPDPHIFLQTAYDMPMPYDPANPAQYAVDRRNLDELRIKAVYDFLNAQTAGRGVAWMVTVHDPGEVGMHSVPMLRSVTDFHASFKGTLPIGVGGGAVGGAPH